MANRHRLRDRNHPAVREFSHRRQYGRHDSSHHLVNRAVSFRRRLVRPRTLVLKRPNGTVADARRTFATDAVDRKRKWPRTGPFSPLKKPLRTRRGFRVLPRLRRIPAIAGFQNSTPTYRPARAKLPASPCCRRLSHCWLPSCLAWKGRLGGLAAHDECRHEHANRSRKSNGEKRIEQLDIEPHFRGSYSMVDIGTISIFGSAANRANANSKGSRGDEKRPEPACLSTGW